MLRIGEWEVEPERNELLRGGNAVRLEPKVIEVLLQLAKRPGKVLGREELLGLVWPGVVVGDDVLTQAIIKLRKALGDDAHAPEYIETIPKRGYRLTAPVAAVEAKTPSSGARKRLGWPWAAAALIAVAAVAWVAIPRAPWPLALDGREHVVSSVPTVAILPLSNLSGDATRDYFSDGLTEDMIGALGRFSGVRVMSRNAVQPYRGTSPTPQAVRQELGARYVVQGSLREAQGRVRVSIQLADTENGSLLWSQQHEAEGGQLFEVQDRIVKDIVGSLQGRLAQIEQQRSFGKASESLEAYDLVLRARSLMGQAERGANRQARELLARAAKLSPDYAMVTALQSRAEFQRATYGWVEDATRATARAEALALQALASADTRAHPEAHALLASVYMHHARYDEALLQSERGIEINPSDAVAIYQRARVLLTVGRIEPAIAAFEAAKRFDPRPIAANSTSAAMAYFLVGRHADALTESDAAIARSPGHGFAHAMRAAALEQLGNKAEAAKAAADAQRANPAFRVDEFASGLANPEHRARLQEAVRRAGS